MSASYKTLYSLARKWVELDAQFPDNVYFVHVVYESGHPGIDETCYTCARRFHPGEIISVIVLLDHNNDAIGNKFLCPACYAKLVSIKAKIEIQSLLESYEYDMHKFTERVKKTIKKERKNDKTDKNG